jgi:two-component sensor histidine kinase
MAAQLFDVPIAIVSLVDADRIWFKSHHGLEINEIPRDPGLCATAILGNKPLVLPDAQADPLAKTNPLVAGDFGLRFYAGVPLRTHDGFNLGALCVVDQAAHAVSDVQVAQLVELANVVVDEMELRRSARQAVAKLQRSVSEKEVLLREVHHRVKNNLQVIASLVMLQQRSAPDEAKPLFEDMLRRIESVGRLHERFYRGPGVEEMALLGFLDCLARDVIETYGLADRVTVEMGGEDLSAGLDRCTPISLIVAELVANACKHAFPAGRAGRIRITGQRAGAAYTLTVADDGRGMQTASSGSVGLQLVTLMVRQLDGTYDTRSTEGGTEATISFPV